MILDTTTLPDDLLWINEFEWNPVEQTTERSLTGAFWFRKGNSPTEGQSFSLAMARPVGFPG